MATDWSQFTPVEDTPPHKVDWSQFALVDDAAARNAPTMTSTVDRLPVAPEPSLSDTLGNIADSIGYGVTNLPNLGANLIEKVAPLNHEPNATASYGSGLGALVDNPITRGLGQAADTGAAGLNELLGRVFVAPVDYFRPGTLEAYRNRMVTPAVQAAQAQEAPSDAPLAERALQGLASLAGQVSIAGASGGGTADAQAATDAAAATPTLAKMVANAIKAPQARLAGTLGSEAGGAQVAAQEANGQPVSNAKAASIIAANTAANLIPFGEGMPLAARIPAGVGAGVTGSALVNAANGQPLLEGALPAGTLGALLGGIAAHGEAPRAEPARAPENVPALDDIATRMRAELKASGLSDAQIEAILNPAPEPQTAALPAPVVHVDSAGNAATQAQAEAAQRAAQGRAAELGLSPDVIAAQAVRNARAPAEAAPAAPRALPPPVVHVDASGNASTSADFMQQLRAAADALQRQRALGLTPDVERARTARLERQTAGLPVRDLSGMDAALAEEGRRPAEQGAPEPVPGAPAPAPEKVANYFANLHKEIGWEQRGGGIIRGEGSGLSPGDHAMAEDRSGPVIGRMPWIPKIGGDGQPSQFWRMRPDKTLTEAQAHEAFRKVSAGEPLRPIEQRFVDYAQKTAHDYAQAEAEDTARFEAEQREADDIERQRAIEDLRAENARFATTDHGEAFTLAQWIRRAHDAGVPRELVGAAMNHDDWTQRLTALIREHEHGADQGTTVVGDERGVSPDRQGQAPAVREGEGAPGQEGAGQPEPDSAEAAAGQVRFSRPGTPPSGDLFGAPTSADRLRAAQEAKDAQRNGKTGSREPTGDGGLFDGQRPEQARIAEPKQPDQLFRRPAPPATHTPEQVRATLRGSPLGRAFGKLEEAGALRIESHPDQDWSGYWDGDKAVLNAARAGEEGWLGTAMHELGGHGSLHDMLGDEGFARALSDIRSLADAKGPAGDIVRRAMRRVESADTPARHRDEELLAYTISEAVREGKAWKNGALNSALVRIFNRIRAWMKTSAIGKLLAKHGVDWKLNPDDIAALAESGIRRMARESGGESAREPLAEPAFTKQSVPAAEQTDTPAFRRWFGDSKVVDAQGKPLTVYHGTADGFYAFDNARLGEATAHMTAPLGHFFAEDAGKAQRYAENASKGVPADERVIDAHLSIQNPKALSLDDLMGIESQDEARALKAKLAAQGYDGIHIHEIGQWIAFDPSQIKSASENVGSFDRGNPDIRYSRPTPQDRAGEEGRGASGPGEPGSTGVKNAQTKAERAARGLDEVRVAMRRSDPQVAAAAESMLRDDPQLGLRLAAEVSRKQRALTPEEQLVLGLDRARIFVDRHKAAEAVNVAVKNGDAKAEAIARDRLFHANQQLETSDIASRLSGYEQGLALSVRRLLAQLDYSREGMETRLQAAKGKPLDVDELNRLRDLHQKMQDVEARLAGRQEAQRGKQKETKAQLDEQLKLFKDQLDQAESRKDVARQKQLRKQIAELARRIVEGDYSKTTRTPIQYNEETRRLEAERNMLRGTFEEMAAKAERLNRSPVKKTLAMIHDLQMMSILASLHVYKKLAYAVGGGHAMSLMADATRSMARHVPGIKGIAEEAPQYGRGLDLDALKARAQGVKEAPREALNQLRYGMATREAAHGMGRGFSDEYFTFAGTLADAVKTKGALNKAMETTRALAGYVGRSHAAEKEFLSQPEFREGIARETKFLQRQMEKSGMSPDEIAQAMASESTQAAIAAKGLERAFEKKMQGKNDFSRSVDAMIGTLDRSQNAGANFLGFMLKTIFPIRKVGVNIVVQGTSLMAGGVKALAAALKKGDMTPERADYIMKNIGEQGAGAILLALGAIYYDQFGGVPGVFSKKDRPKHRDATGNIIKPGEADGFGTEAFHGAPAAMIQVGASMAQVFQKEHGKRDGLDLALNVAARPSLAWLARTIPYTDTLRRMTNTAEYGRGRKEGTLGAIGEIAGQTARGILIPGVVQQTAAATDPYKGYRRPRNVGEDIELGIPGLREHVPTHPQRRP